MSQAELKLLINLRLYRPVDVGDGQAVQLAHHGQHGHGEGVTLVTEEVGEVGAYQDDSGSFLSVILNNCYFGKGTEDL